MNYFRKILTQLAGYLSCLSIPLITRFSIRFFIAFYKVNMQEAKTSNPSSYKTFNNFFTRELKEGARNFCMSQDSIISPADGVLSSIGKIKGEELIQAKNKSYTLSSLLAHDKEGVDCFQDGLFFTVYLSPKDYHRVHAPYAGRCFKTTYVPGKLLSVSTKTASDVDNLFAENERVISYFETDNGYMAVILVGATIVGSMQLAWQGVVNSHRKDKVITSWDWEDESIYLKKGEELGQFNLGSTVIVLYSCEKNIDWPTAKALHQSVKVGESLVSLS